MSRLGYKPALLLTLLAATASAGPLSVESVEVLDYRIDRKKPFVTSKGTSNSVYGLFFLVTAKSGEQSIVGLGDALPRGTVTNESINDAFAGAQAMAPVVKGLTFDGDLATDRETIVRTMAKLSDIAAAQKLTYAHPPAPDKQLRATLCGVEMALLDLVARRHNVPLAEVLGPVVRDKVSVSALTANADATADELADQAEESDAYGAVRVKIGLNVDDDLHKLVAVAKAMPAEKPSDIWVDVNQAWKTAEASIDNLNKIRAALSKAGYAGRFICEQPTVETDLPALAAVTKAMRAGNDGAKCKIVVMADEAVWTLADAKKMVELDAADYLNIKIQKSGGLLEAMEIGRYLQEKSPATGIYVGGVVSTDITAYANLQLCFALPRLDFATGCVPRRANKFNPAASPLKYDDGKSFDRPKAPGLGTALKSDGLKPYVRRDYQH